MDRAKIEEISKALADETRLRIFEAIAQRQELNCGEVVALNGVTAATVSHHLRVLADAGLIECRRKGQFVCSRVVPSTLKEYTQALSRLSAGSRKKRKSS